jgi:hypothetical protein
VTIFQSLFPAHLRGSWRAEAKHRLLREDLDGVPTAIWERRRSEVALQVGAAARSAAGWKHMRGVTPFLGTTPLDLKTRGGPNGLRRHHYGQEMQNRPISGRDCGGSKMPPWRVYRQRGLYYEAYIDASFSECKSRVRNVALRLAEQVIKTFQIRRLDEFG